MERFVTAAVLVILSLSAVFFQAQAVASVGIESLPIDALLSLANDKKRTRFWVDVDNGGVIRGPDGRAFIFHGTNVVQKKHPFIPSTSGADCEETSGPAFQRSLCDKDIANLKSWGFNVVRLGVMWQAVTPKDSKWVNQTYLDEVQNLVTHLYENGIYTLIDAHQDVLASQLCGEGIPEWALENALQLSKWNFNATWKQFPSPLPYKFGIDEKTGYPDVKNCQKHDFGSFYFSFEAMAALDALWTSPSIWAHFAYSWKNVAKTLKDTPGVIGYELINEPLNPSNLLKTDTEVLLPLYQTLHKAIREVDNETIIFYEPLTSGEYTGLASSSWVSDFTPEKSPGGIEYQDRQVYSYHIYCGLDGTGSPNNWLSCKLLSERSFDVQKKTRKRLGGAGMLTEFGAVGYSRSSIRLLKLMTREADKALQSWMYWSFKSFDDITTANPGTETFYFDNGTLQQGKVDALKRTFACEIAGTPISMKQNNEETMFELEFVPMMQSSNKTRIFTHRPIAAVFVSPILAVEYVIEEPYLVVMHNVSQVSSGTVVRVTITY